MVGFTDHSFILFPIINFIHFLRGIGSGNTLVHKVITAELINGRFCIIVIIRFFTGIFEIDIEISDNGIGSEIFVCSAGLHTPGFVIAGAVFGKLQFDILFFRTAVSGCILPGADKTVTGIFFQFGFLVFFGAD